MARKPKVAKPELNIVPKDEAIRRATWECSIPLTESEMNNRRDQAADLQERLDDREKALETLVEKHKEAKGELDKEIKETSEKISQFLREIKSESAQGLHEGDEVLNYERGVCEFWYPNRETGKLVKERAFTVNEHQRHLFTEKAESIPSTGMDPLENETMQ